MLLDKLQKKLFQVKLTESYIEIFLVYPPRDHLIAHLWEHLVYRQIKKIKNLLIVKSNTGSGIVNLKFKYKKSKEISFKDVDEILSLKKLNKDDFELEKQRLSNELTEIMNNKFRFFYQAIQFQNFNYKKLLQDISEIENIKFNKLKVFVNKIRLNKLNNLFIITTGPQLKNKKIIKFIPKKYKEEKPLKIITLKNNSKNKFCQLNLEFDIKNILEAYYLQIISKYLYFLIKDILVQKGIYKLDVDLFKSYSKKLYLNFSFYCQQNKIKKMFDLIIKELKTVKFNRADLLKEKKEIINYLKEIKANSLIVTEDCLWQNLEWNNHINLDIQIKKLNKLVHKSIQNWWNKKIKNIEFYKVVI